MGSPLVQHLLPLLYSLNSLCYYINYFIYYFIFIMDIILVFIIRELWFKRFLKVLHGCCWRICNCFLAFIFLQKVPCDVGLCLIQPWDSFCCKRYFIGRYYYRNYLWNHECFVEDLFLGGQWSIILGYRRLSVKSLQVLLLVFI